MIKIEHTSVIGFDVAISERKPLQDLHCPMVIEDKYQIDLITMITSQQSEMKDVLFDSLENEFVKKFEIVGNIYDNPELLK